MNPVLYIAVLMLICYTIAVAWRTFDWFISAPLRHVTLSDYVFWHGRMYAVTAWVFVMEVILVTFGLILKIFI